MGAECTQEGLSPCWHWLHLPCGGSGSRLQRWGGALDHSDLVVGRNSFGVGQSSFGNWRLVGTPDSVVLQDHFLGRGFVVHLEEQRVPVGFSVLVTD